MRAGREVCGDARGFGGGEFAVEILFEERPALFAVHLAVTPM